MKHRRLSRKKGLSPAVVPMYLWTILFVAIPLIYILGMSFLKKAETWGVVMEFSLESYQGIFNPTYLKVFGQSLLIAFLTTCITLLLGYPFAYFTAGLPPKK